MKSSPPYSLASLAKIKPKRASSPSAAKKGAPAEYPKTTPWGREFLRRLDKLHKALDGQKLA